MNFIITKDEYLQAKKAWTQPGYHHNAADHIIYNALRGFDLKRGFSPVTDQQKLNNGFSEWQSYDTAKSNARWEVRESSRWAGETPERTARRNAEDAERYKTLGLKFGVTFTPELLTTIRELLK